MSITIASSEVPMATIGTQTFAAILLSGWTLLYIGIAQAQELKPPPTYVADANTENGQTLDFPRDNPAVQVISDDTAANEGKEVDSNVQPMKAPGWWDNLFSHGSPFYFGLTVGETYDDNIFISQQKTGDFYTHVTPYIDFVKGDKTASNENYLNLVFRPTFFFYSNNSDQNRTDYYADGIYQHQWTRLTLSLEQRYEQLTDASIDVGNFFKREVYTTTLHGNYDVDDKLSVGATETQRLSSFDNQAISSTGEWLTDAYVQYQVASKLTLGLGPRVGFADITGAPNQTYEDLLARVSYDVTSKFTVNFDGGAEYRQFQGSTDRVFPVFNITASYTPFDGTLLSLSGYRNDVISYSEIGDDYLSTLVQVSVRQRFLRNFFFNASGGYNLAQYQGDSSTGTTGGQRRDDYYFVNVGLEWDPREWISVSGRVQVSQDKSTFAQSSFNDSQVDLQTAVQF
jgi:hypothetical protein